MKAGDLEKAKDSIRLILTTNATGYTTDKRVNEIAKFITEAYNIGYNDGTKDAQVSPDYNG